MLTTKLASRSFGSFIALRKALCTTAAGALLLGTWSADALASPVLLAGSGQEKVHSTHVVVMEKDGMTALTVMPDYQGPLSPFALVIPIPDDVTLDDVVATKREFVDRLDQLSAPKFAEFWEMDPCEKGSVQQEWERDMTANSDTGFLGVMKTDPAKKVAKELLMDVAAKKKDGEYTETFVGSGDEVLAWLSTKKYALPAGGEDSIKKYAAGGYKFVALAVDPNRIELIGGDRATLSPIRIFTRTEVKTLPVRFGLPSAPKAQELLVFTLVGDQRMQVGNYPTKPAPTNLTVEFAVKERMGEFYSAIHDRFLEKNPGTFLAEYAFTTGECAKPCPTEPVMPHEMLSLGGDALDATLPEEVRRPKPPEPTEEELQKLEAQLAEKTTPAEKKAVKKAWEEDRAELAARKAMIARHTYVLSRLHYRYSKDQLPKDPELVAGAAITGGQDLPKGPDGAASLEVKPTEQNAFQTRFNNLHPNITVVKCEDPVPYRWGKPPRTYRGLNKIWIAEDLSRKDRKQIDPAINIVNPVPELGFPGKAAQAEAPAAPEVPVEEKKEGCGCRTAGGAPERGGWAALLGLGLLAALRRRRQPS